MSFKTISVEDTENMSNYLTKEIASAARRGFRPDEIAILKRHGSWGVPPLTVGKGESLTADGRKVEARRKEQSAQLAREMLGPDAAAILSVKR